MVLKYARGRMLDIQVESETYPIRAAGLRPDFARDENVPFLDVVATYDAKEKRIAVFALNRDISNERELALTLRRHHAVEGARLRNGHRHRISRRSTPSRARTRWS